MTLQKDQCCSKSEYSYWERMSPSPFLPGITLTGADDSVTIDDLLVLKDLSYRVEIGILYTYDPEGRPRHPTVEKIEEMVDRLGDRCAIHVCGGRARRALFEDPIPLWLRLAGRIQVNGIVLPEELLQLTDRYQCIITQHTPENAGLEMLEDLHGRHDILVDGSGGRGILPDRWVTPFTSKTTFTPFTSKTIGYAGGLSPTNLASQLDRITPNHAMFWWVDMESSLRTFGDRFCPALAVQAVQEFHAWGERMKWGRRDFPVLPTGETP